MSLIAEYLGVNPKTLTTERHAAWPGIGALGYEVELENAGKWPAVPGWVKKPDGSLRDGVEYIFDGPQHGEAAAVALEKFHDAMLKAKPDPTFRCSTHVHVDVRDMDFTKYERLVLAYMVYEDVMFDHLDRRRRDSNFCVPFYKNDWLSAAFGRRILAPQENGQKFRGMGNWPKYSALNLQVTANFGSVEFRGGHAMTDKVELLQLGQRMLALKNLAMESKAPDHFSFLNEIKALPIAKAFPMGIRKGYAMDEGALDQGVSTAMHALLTCEMERMGMNPMVPEGFNAAAPARDNGQARAIRTVLDSPTRLDAAALRALNLQAPARETTTKDLLRMLAALNMLEGVNVALTALAPGFSRDFLRHIRNNVEAYNNRLGYNLPVNQLN